MKPKRVVTLLLVFIMVLTMNVPVAAAEREGVPQYVLGDGMVSLVCTEGNGFAALANAGVITLTGGHQIIMLHEDAATERSPAIVSIVEITIYSPIADLIGHKVSADVASLDGVFNVDKSAMNEEMVAAHQEWIDEIIALMEEHEVESYCDLSSLAERLQDLFAAPDMLDCEHGYIPIMPFWCPGGVCRVVPVWIIIGGVAFAGVQCIDCGRAFILV